MAGVFAQTGQERSAYLPGAYRVEIFFKILEPFALLM
jgi:hypothetical protein